MSSSEGARKRQKRGAFGAGFGQATASAWQSAMKWAQADPTTRAMAGLAPTAPGTFYAPIGASEADTAALGALQRRAEASGTYDDPLRRAEQQAARQAAAEDADRRRTLTLDPAYQEELRAAQRAAEDARNATYDRVPPPSRALPMPDEPGGPLRGAPGNFRPATAEEQAAIEATVAESRPVVASDESSHSSTDEPGQTVAEHVAAEELRGSYLLMRLPGRATPHKVSLTMFGGGIALGLAADAAGYPLVGLAAGGGLTALGAYLSMARMCGQLTKQPSIFRGFTESIKEEAGPQLVLVSPAVVTAALGYVFGWPPAPLALGSVAGLVAVGVPMAFGTYLKVKGAYDDVTWALNKIVHPLDTAKEVAGKVNKVGDELAGLALLKQKEMEGESYGVKDFFSDAKEGFKDVWRDVTGKGGDKKRMG